MSGEKKHTTLIKPTQDLQKCCRSLKCKRSLIKRWKAFFLILSIKKKKGQKHGHAMKHFRMWCYWEIMNFLQCDSILIWLTHMLEGKKTGESYEKMQSWSLFFFFYTLHAVLANYRSALEINQKVYVHGLCISRYFSSFVLQRANPAVLHLEFPQRSIT